MKELELRAKLAQQMDGLVRDAPASLEVELQQSRAAVGHTHHRPVCEAVDVAQEQMLQARVCSCHVDHEVVIDVPASGQVQVLQVTRVGHKW